MVLLAVVLQVTDGRSPGGFHPKFKRLKRVGIQRIHQDLGETLRSVFLFGESCRFPPVVWNMFGLKGVLTKNSVGPE